ATPFRYFRQYSVNNALRHEVPTETVAFARGAEPRFLHLRVNLAECFGGAVAEKLLNTSTSGTPRTLSSHPCAMSPVCNRTGRTRGFASALSRTQAFYPGVQPSPR